MFPSAMQAMQTRRDESWMLRFADFQKLIGGNVAEQLFDTGRPENLYRRFFSGAQAEVKPLVIGRDVAAGRSCETNLAIHTHACTVSITITSRASQSNCEPMAAAAAVDVQHARTAESRQNNIHKTIVVDVAECGTPRSNGRRDTRIGAFEMAVMIQREQRQLLVSK